SHPGPGDDDPSGFTAARVAPGRRRDGIAPHVARYHDERVVRRAPAAVLGVAYLASSYRDAFAFGAVTLILVGRPEGLLGLRLQRRD
ncbi:MAG TPA: hypothetical protein VGW35_03570, partial [Methylomirabilota bacterium]|nr:hypothetical protein [Methylomirabilota bacterium]